MLFPQTFVNRNLHESVSTKHYQVVLSIRLVTQGKKFPS